MTSLPHHNHKPSHGPLRSCIVITTSRLSVEEPIMWPSEQPHYAVKPERFRVQGFKKVHDLSIAKYRVLLYFFFWRRAGGICCNTPRILVFIVSQHFSITHLQIQRHHASGNNEDISHVLVLWKMEKRGLQVRVRITHSEIRPTQYISKIDVSLILLTVLKCRITCTQYVVQSQLAYQKPIVVFGNS